MTMIQQSRFLIFSTSQPPAYYYLISPHQGRVGDMWCHTESGSEVTEIYTHTKLVEQIFCPGRDIEYRTQGLNGRFKPKTVTASGTHKAPSPKPSQAYIEFTDSEQRQPTRVNYRGFSQSQMPPYAKLFEIENNGEYTYILTFRNGIALRVTLDEKVELKKEDSIDTGPL